MTFLDTQALINYSWEKRKESFESDWGRKRKKNDNPLKVRKKMLCMECAKQGFKIKLDFVKNIREQHLYSVYDVEIWQCPRCKKVERVMKKDSGKGRNGINSYMETAG